MNPIESISFEKSFKYVVVNLNDGNQILMGECVRCGFVCRNKMLTKKSHWKECPSKWIFKYVRQGIEGFVAVCGRCDEQLIAPSSLDMKNHFEQCTPLWLLNENNLNQSYFFPNQLNADPASNEVNYIQENTVSQIEIKAQIIVHEKINNFILQQGFKIKLISDSMGLQRHAECQRCKSLFVRPSANAIQAHRCNFQRTFETHLSRFSQPIERGNIPNFQAHYSTPMTTSTSTGQAILNSFEEERSYTQPSLSESLQQKLCYICNTSTTDAFANLNTTFTKYSNTKISDFILKFLSKELSIGKNSNRNFVCSDCLEIINKYDMANTKADAIESKLCKKLYQTESYYAKNNCNIQSSKMNAVEQSGFHGDLYDSIGPDKLSQAVEPANECAENEDDDVYELVEVDGDEIETIELSD